MEHNKKEKMPLFVPVLWFITSGMWPIRILCIGVHYGLEADLLTVLAFGASLAAAIVNYIRYRSSR